MEDTTITFEPHIRTLTESGRSHFVRPVDAIAEYIDNSIQACSKNETTRSIGVGLFLGGRSSAFSFLVLSDNGIGMDIQTIKEFATYSLDQESRNRQPEKLDSSFIGKFGVGAKQAGFFLGDRIKLITKPKDFKSGECLSFCLDSEELHSRYELQQAIYEGNVRRFPVTEIDFKQDELLHVEMINFIKKHMNDCEQGTVFVIRLRYDVAKALSSMHETKVPSDIKDIYHFHLHPDHLDQKESSKASNSRLDLAPLEIAFTRCFGYNGEKKYSCNLQEIQDFTEHCIERSCNAFKFSMETVMPNVDVDISRHGSQFSQTNGSKTIRIEGLLLYFPYKNGCESRPHLSDVIDLADGSDHAVDLNANSESIVRVYWQNRLVPETEVKDLPFFPNTTSLNKAKVTRNWKSRVVGFLFFDWQFNLIANNKLKLLLDLNEWLNNKANAKNILFYPKNCSSEFVGWLEECHKHDREYVFSDREYTISGEVAQTTFRTLTFRHHGKRITTGDTIKFKGPNKTSPIIFAEVVDFLISKQLSDFESYYFGTGQLRFKRIPKALYGDKIEQESITLINAEDYSIKADELESLNREVPESVNVYLFETIEDKGSLINNRNVELVLGKKYFKIGIQIMNRDKKAVCFLPDSGNDKKSIRYSIRVTLSDGKDYGKTNDLWKYNSTTGVEDQIVTAQKRDFKTSYFGVYNIMMDRPGDKSFVITVIAPAGHIICETQIPFQVLSLQAEKIVLLDCCHLACCLGQPFPALKIQFYDYLNNIVSFEGDVKLELTSNEMDVLPNGSSKEYIRKIQATDDGVLSCHEGDWVAIPKKDATLFSSDRVIESKEVPFILKAITQEADSKGRLKFSHQIGDPISFSVIFSPGSPVKMTLLEPTVYPIKLTGEPIPLMHLSITDFWNNKVAPRNDEKWEIHFSEGPINKENIIIVNANGDAFGYNLTICSDEMFSTQSLQLLRDSQPCGCELDLEFEFNPSEEPKVLQILKDHEVLPSLMVCTAGEKVENLSFEILNEYGGSIDLSMHRTLKTSWMECGWGVVSRNNRNRTPIPVHNQLPDLQIPQDTDLSPFHTHLEVALGGQILECEVVVTIVAGAASKWKLLGSFDTSPFHIEAGDSTALNSLQGACLVDSFGNITRTGVDSAALPVLRLMESNENDDDQDSGQFKVIVDIPLVSGKIQGHGGVVSEDKQIPAKKRKRNTPSNDSTKSSELEGFRLPSDIVLPQLTPGKLLYMQVMDVSEKYEASDRIECMVTKASPQMVMISSDQYGIVIPQVHCEIKVGTFTNIDDIWIHIVDSAGNEPNLDDIQNIKVEIFCPKGKKVFTKNDVKCYKIQATISYDFNDTTTDTEIVFTCKVSYKKHKEVIQLPESTIQCNLIKFNNVIDLKLQAYSNIELLPTLSQIVDSSYVNDNNVMNMTRNSNKYSIVLPCGTSPPILTLMLVTEDNIPFIPELETFSVSAKRKVGKERSRISFMELFDCEIEDDNYRLVFIPTDAFHNNILCTYELDILYKEQRPSLAALPEDKKSIKIQVSMSYVPGIPCNIKLDKLSQQKLQNRIVSDTLNVSEGGRRRILGEQIKLHATDRFGNICTFPTTSNVICTISSPNLLQPENSSSSSDVPALYYDNTRCNHVNGIFSSNRDECKFPKIEIAPFDTSTPPIKDGQYYLTFKLIDSNTVIEHEIEFEFTSNNTYMKYMNDIQGQLEPLLIKREEYEDKMNKYNTLCARYKHVHDNATPQIKSAQGNLTSLRDLQDRRRQEIDDMRNQATQRRIAKKKPNYPDPLKLTGKDIIGQIVELAYVEDLNEAHIMSWASTSLIDAIAVHDTTTALQLYEDKVKVISLDQIVPFQLYDKKVDKKRPRNEQEMKSQQLDLPPILISNGKKMIKPNGNPRYLVNILVLEPDYEYLRDTLFYNIFGNAIMFDNFKDALEYRKTLVKANQRPPTLFTLAGEKISQNAVLDPSGNARLPNHLEYVYGEPKVKQIAEMQATYDLEMLDEIIQLTEDINALKNEISTIDIDDIQSRIVQLEEKKGSMKMTWSQR